MDLLAKYAQKNGNKDIHRYVRLSYAGVMFFA